jgi:predicted nucleotidyltransferase
LDNSEIIGKLKEFSNAVNNYFNPELIVLYGSYARGNWHKDSDIDVAVIFDILKGNPIDLSINLYKLRRDIDLRIEPVIISKSNDPSGFLSSIMEYGTIIYKRN